MNPVLCQKPNHERKGNAGRLHVVEICIMTQCCACPGIFVGGHDLWADLSEILRHSSIPTLSPAVRDGPERLSINCQAPGWRLKLGVPNALAGIAHDVASPGRPTTASATSRPQTRQHRNFEFDYNS
jgi:hypothetical protein